MSQHRPTQQDIARAAGVHRATVSLVLRDHPSIPESTRKKVRKIAREIGYKPDPMLSALAAYRSRTTPRSFQGVLAWVAPASLASNHPTSCAPLFEGAARQAQSLGYQLQEFIPGLHYHRERDLRRILQAQGIKGILFYQSCLPDFDLSGFSALALGPLPSIAPIHTITQHPGAMHTIAHRRLLERGFRRIGILLPAPSSQGHQPLHHFPMEPREGLLSYLVESPSLPLGEKWHQWYLRHRPDALIAGTPELAQQLEASGMNIPRELSVAVVGLTSRDSFWSGLNANFGEMGRIATNALVEMIHSHEEGVPAIRRSILIESSWIEGHSIGSPASKQRVCVG